MRYPKPTDRYSCEVLCDNFMEIDMRLSEIEENSADYRNKAGAIIEKASGESPLCIRDTAENLVRNLKLYGKSEQDGTSGKNLLKNTATSQNVKGVAFDVQEDGTIIANGTATSAVTLRLYEGEIPHDAILSGGLSANRKIQIVHHDGTAYHVLAKDEGNGSNIDTSTYDSGYVEISIASGEVLSNAVFKPMIRLASITDSTYEPYKGGRPSPNPYCQEEIKSVVVSEVKVRDESGNENSITLSQPIELNGIGDVMDELTPDGVTRRFAVGTLDKSGWKQSGSITDTYLEVTKYDVYIGQRSGTLNILSNYFSQEDDSRVVMTDSAAYVRFPIAIFSTFSEAYTWLANHDVKFVYELATPITEPLPTADQIALRSLLSYDGVTYLEVDSEVAPMIDAEVVLDTKKYIDSKAGGDTYSKAEIDAMFAGISVADLPDAEGVAF